MGSPGKPVRGMTTRVKISRKWQITGRLWTSRKHEWWCLSYLNCTGQDTPLKDWITWRICGCSVTKSYPTICDPMDSSTPGFPDFQYLPEILMSSCPLSRWCHLTILSSVVRFSSFPQSFPAPGSFLMSQFFTSGGQNFDSIPALYQKIYTYLFNKSTLFAESNPQSSSVI